MNKICIIKHAHQYRVSHHHCLLLSKIRNSGIRSKNRVISVFIFLSQFPTLPRSHQPSGDGTAGAISSCLNAIWNLWFLSWFVEPFYHTYLFSDFSCLVRSGYFWPWPKLPMFWTVFVSKILVFPPYLPFFDEAPTSVQHPADHRLLCSALGNFPLFQNKFFPTDRKENTGSPGLLLTHHPNLLLTTVSGLEGHSVVLASNTVCTLIWKN